MRIALLHLAPIPGDISHNRNLVQTGSHNRSWIRGRVDRVAGTNYLRLFLCGHHRYRMDLAQPNPWMVGFCQLVAQLGVTVFSLASGTRSSTDKLYNTVFVVDPDGNILGKHRKINALKVGSESWSTPGEVAVPFPVSPFKSVGILICADTSTHQVFTPSKFKAHNYWFQRQRGHRGFTVLVANGSDVRRKLVSPCWCVIVPASIARWTLPEPKVWWSKMGSGYCRFRRNAPRLS